MIFWREGSRVSFSRRMYLVQLAMLMLHAEVTILWCKH